MSLRRVRMNKSFLPKPNEIDRKWYLVDAEGEILGRMATRIARILSGKSKPIFSPSVDTGDFVVVINAGKVRLTGNKLKQKFYYRHSGYPGGLKATRYDVMMEKKPEEVIKLAVKGMLPKNKLQARMLKRLKVYAGGHHPHAAQKCETIKVTK